MLAKSNNLESLQKPQKIHLTTLTQRYLKLIHKNKSLLALASKINKSVLAKFAWTKIKRHKTSCLIPAYVLVPVELSILTA